MSYGGIFIDRYVDREAQSPVSFLLEPFPGEVRFITPARLRTLDLLRSICTLLFIYFIVSSTTMMPLGHG